MSVAPIPLLGRRRVLGVGGLATLGVVAGCADSAPPSVSEHEMRPASAAEHAPSHEDTPPTADEAWQRLEEGNARFVS